MLYASPIDDQHQPTGGCRHIIKAAEVGRVAGLAICQYDNEEGVYLFGCDEQWRAVTDTWHATEDDAKAQAEFEYRGVSETWLHPGAT